MTGECKCNDPHKWSIVAFRIKYSFMSVSSVYTMLCLHRVSQKRWHNDLFWIIQVKNEPISILCTFYFSSVPSRWCERPLTLIGLLACRNNASCIPLSGQYGVSIDSLHNLASCACTPRRWHVGGPSTSFFLESSLSTKYMHIKRRGREKAVKEEWEQGRLRERTLHNHCRKSQA